MSTLSSTVNSLSAVSMEDFVKRFYPNISNKKYVQTSRLLSLFWGIVCLFLAFFTGNIEGTVIEVINKVGSVFYGPILGVFVLAILTKKTHALGANIGILAGVFLNIYLWLYVPDIFWFWWNAIGCLVTIMVGYIISNLIKKEVTGILPFNFYAGKREFIILFGYFLFIVILSSLISKIF